MNIDKRNKRVLVRTFTAFVTQGFGAIVVFLMYLVAARKLGASQSGLFFLAYTIITVLASISTLGLGTTILRLVGSLRGAGNWDKINAALEKSLKWVLLSSITVAVCIYINAEWLSLTIFEKDGLTNLVKWMSIGIPFVSLSFLLGNALQGLHKIPQAIFTNKIGVPLIMLVLFIGGGLIDSNRPLLGLHGSWFFSIGALLNLLIAIFWWFKLPEVNPVKKKINNDELLKSCLPLLVVILMGNAVAWSGQFASGVWATTEEVATFAVAQRTALLVSFILVAVNNVAAPYFSSYFYQGRKGDLERIVKFTTRLMLLFAFPIVSVLILFPGFIMSVFGEEFRDGYILLQILAIGQFVNVATGSVGILLTMSGHEREFRNAVILSGVIAIPLAIILTQYFGVLGSAIATAIALSAQNIYSVWIVKKKFGINTFTIAFERVKKASN